MAIIKRDSFETKTIMNEATTTHIQEIEFDLEQIEKAGYEHFMLKEIFEQPETFKDAFRGRLLADKGNVKLGGLAQVQEKLRNAKRLL